jgi:hypothetical protein
VAGGSASRGDLAGFFGDRVDVVGQRQGDHVGGQPVDHRAGLLARPAVRLVDRHRFAGFRLPLAAKAALTSRYNSRVGS